jgi:hypothetical protein
MKAMWRKRYNKGRQVENSFDSPVRTRNETLHAKRRRLNVTPASLLLSQRDRCDIKLYAKFIKTTKEDGR